MASPNVNSAMDSVTREVNRRVNALGPNERREFWRELEVYAQVPRREADKAAADEAAAAEANAGMKPEGK